MQETVKLITSSEFRKGQVNSLPDVGDVQFDSDGIIEVPKEFAQGLVDSIQDLSFLEKSEPVKPEETIKPQTQEEDLTKSDDKDSLTPQTEQNDINGSAEPLTSTDGQELPKDEEKEEEKEEEKSEDGKQADPAEIKAKLEEKSFVELKELVAQFDAELTVKSKKDAIEYLLTKLV